MKILLSLFYVFCLLAIVKQCLAIGISFDPTSGYMILVVAGIILAEKRREDGKEEGKEIARLETTKKFCVWLYDPALGPGPQDGVTITDEEILALREECLRCVERKGKDECEQLSFCEFRDNCCFRKLTNVIIDAD